MVRRTQRKVKWKSIKSGVKKAQSTKKSTVKTRKTGGNRKRTRSLTGSIQRKGIRY